MHVSNVGGNLQHRCGGQKVEVVVVKKVQQLLMVVRHLSWQL